MTELCVIDLELLRGTRVQTVENRGNMATLIKKLSAVVSASILVGSLAACGARANDSESWTPVETFETLKISVNGHFTEGTATAGFDNTDPAARMDSSGNIDKEPITEAEEDADTTAGLIKRFVTETEKIKVTEPWGLTEQPAAIGTTPTYGGLQSEPLISTENYKVYGGWEPIQNVLFGLDFGYQWVHFNLVYGTEWVELAYKLSTETKRPVITLPDGSSKTLKLKENNAEAISKDIFNAAFKIEETAETQASGDLPETPLVALKLESKTPLDAITSVSTTTADTDSASAPVIPSSSTVQIRSFGNRPASGRSGATDPLLVKVGVADTDDLGTELEEKDWATLATLPSGARILSDTANLALFPNDIHAPFVYYLSDDVADTFTRFEILAPGYFENLSEQQIKEIVNNSRQRNKLVAGILTESVEFEQAPATF